VDGVTAMRSYLIATGILAATLAAGSASACIPYPPPHFPTLRANDGPPIFIGRVLSVEPKAALRENPRFEIHDAAAVISVLEVVQGEMPTEVEYVAATSVRLKPGQPAMDGWCGDYMTLQPGDLILGLQRSWGLQVLRPEQVGEDDISERIESHR